MMNTEQNMPLVSIIMNCFNSERYLREAIDSVIAQTYINWEIIFWDNCSTDNSATIVHSYNNTKIHYYYAPNHTSLGEARNRALEKVNGDFIAFLDVDDWWEVSFLEQTLEVLVKHANEFAGVFPNYYVFDRTNECIRIKLNSKPFGFKGLLEYYDIGMSACVIERKILVDNNISFDNSYSLIEDYDFFLKVAYVRPLFYLDVPLMHYRVHDLALSNTQKKGWGKELNRLYNKIIQKNPLFANDKNVKWIKARAVNSDINEQIESGNRREVFRLVLENWKYSSKLLFPLLYVFLGKEAYKFIYNKIRKPVHKAF